jgi:predicted DsbA family dithiol-disulfide isomerase
MTNFRIKAVTDTVCPWCYVGERRLESAQRIWAQQHPSSGDTFTISHQPFQLNPTLERGPTSSTDKKQYYEKKFGADRTKMIFERLRQVGESEGINFNFGGRTGNTRDSHRLVQLAKKYGSDVEQKILSGLYSGYFENERDITDLEVLIDVAVKAGIPAEDFQKALVDSDECGAEVDRAVSHAVFDGINGVPDFTIQDKIKLNGARDVSEFLEAFEYVKKMEEQSAN